MGRLQVVAVTLCILLLAVDGFDVLSISFAAPGIAAEWGIDRAALGLVLSMELIGMGIGALLPFARGHTGKGNVDKEPWAFGAEVEAAARAQIALRYDPTVLKVVDSAGKPADRIEGGDLLKYGGDALLFPS